MSGVNGVGGGAGPTAHGRMITFDAGSARFTFRVAAVVFDRAGRRVLLHRSERDPFWALPGGRAELFETAEATVARELREELGAVATVERPLWIIENFFEHGGRRQHELGLYFLARFDAGCGLYDRDAPFAGDEGGTPPTFAPFPLDALDGITLYPDCLRDGLRDLPAAPAHIAHHAAGA